MLIILSTFDESICTVSPLEMEKYLADVLSVSDNITTCGVGTTSGAGRGGAGLRHGSKTGL